MKVSDLLTEKVNRVETDKGYTTPNYDAEQKIVLGRVTDWLARIGASKDDIKAALVQAKELDSYKAVAALATDTSSAAELKNGTFSFKHPGGTLRTAPRYHVYANGQIRMSTLNFGERVPTRLVSPKPRLIAGNVIGSLVKIYDGAFKELAKKAEKAVKKSQGEK